MENKPEATLASSLTLRVSCGHSLAILPAGRTRKLSSKPKENFVNFATSLGLTDDHIIFSVPTGNGQLGRRGRDVGMWGLSTLPEKGETQPPALAIGIHFDVLETL